MSDFLKLEASECTDYEVFKLIIDTCQGNGPKFKEVKLWKGIGSTFKIESLLNALKKIKLIPSHKYLDSYGNRYIFSYIRNDVNGLHIVFEIKYKNFSNQEHTTENNVLTLNYYGYNYYSSKEYLDTELAPLLSSHLAEYQKESDIPTMVNVTFGFMEGRNNLSTTITRKIECPVFKAIEQNYPYTNEAITTLFNLNDPDTIGKFIFWHGVPGTGKTYLIRSLIQKWKSTAKTIYITDPDNFFNVPTYMNDLLFSDHGDNPEIYDEDMNDYVTRDQPSKLNLFIIEDGLDFILKESRGYRGDAMSRLLNLTDGILGQGLRHVFLVTSNEIITNIDTAFLRAGRKLQELEFQVFNSKDAINWLEPYGLGLPYDKNKTTYSLSELYELLNEDTVSKALRGSQQKERPIGINVA